MLLEVRAQGRDYVKRDHHTALRAVQDPPRSLKREFEIGVSWESSKVWEKPGRKEQGAGHHVVHVDAAGTL